MCKHHTNPGGTYNLRAYASRLRTKRGIVSGNSWDCKSRLWIASIPPKNTLVVDDLVSIHRRGRTDYTYRRPSRSSTSFGFSAFFPFALLPCFSKIHFHPRSQRFLIRFLVPIDPGILSRLSTTAFTSRTTCWRSLTDRLSWIFEDGESFFRSSIVFLRRSLEGLLLDP